MYWLLKPPFQVGLVGQLLKGNQHYLTIHNIHYSILNHSRHPEYIDQRDRYDRIGSGDDKYEDCLFEKGSIHGVAFS